MERKQPVQEDSSEDELPLEQRKKINLDFGEEDFLNNHPLFMDKLPENPLENKYVAALTELVYDQPKVDIAIQYKEQGNIEFQKKSAFGYKQAIKCYSKALNVECGDAAIDGSILNNRSQAHMNLRYALEDAVNAINLMPNNMKSLFRAAKCSLQLKKYEECKLFVEKALKLDSNNKEILQISKQLEEELEKLKKPDISTQIRTLCKQKKIKLRPKLQECPGSEWGYIKEDRIFWPVLLCYPERSITDFITEVDENCILSDILATVCEDVPPWDLETRHYEYRFLEVYYRRFNKDNEEKFIRIIGRQHTLLEILQYEDIWVPQFPTFYIVSNISSYMEQFKHLVVGQRK